MSYRSINPTTEELLAEYPGHSDAEVDTALAGAARAFGAWSAEPFAMRAQILLRAAVALEGRAEEFARLMATEMGKPMTEGVAEAKKCALACRHYAEHGEEYLRPQEVATDAARSYVIHEPLGPILAIMPWNFPFWQLFRFAAPSLMAGNVVVMKHAPNTPQCALAIEALLKECGLPEGVLRNLFLSNDQAARVIADDRVRGVTLTGSTAAGREVAALAGHALKPSVMELGGSDPFVVFDDANLEEAARTAVISRCLNSGQSCIAAKRFLVQDGAWDRFLELFLDGMRNRVIGDPLLAEVTVGPLARKDLRENLVRQVEESVAAGAAVLLGGHPLERRGFFYPPTVLSDVAPHSPAAGEELFGPVAVLHRFTEEQEAIRLANDTIYGLGASLWTADRERVARLAPLLETGNVFVNGLVKSDPRVPFGGIKASGYGRELGREGMVQFMNGKTVWISGV